MSSYKDIETIRRGIERQIGRRERLISAQTVEVISLTAELKAVNASYRRKCARERRIRSA